MPDPARYFMITGFPKSGNKWFQKMVFEVDAVGGYHREPDRGVPLLARPLLDHPRLSKLLASAGVGLERFMQRLLDPAAPELALDDRRRAELRAILEELAIESSKLVFEPVEASQFDHIFGPPAERRALPRAFGIPGMHVPVGPVQEALPGFDVLTITRDPRDVLVSYFYHLMATLRPPLLRDFVRTTRGGELAMREDWKQRFARRLNARFREFFDSPPRDPQRVHRVRYEDLLSEPVEQMRSVYGFLGCEQPREVIERVVQRYSFQRKTGSTQEQRNSMTRKGQAGDWQNYFDAELVEGLGREFLELVRTLGYEADDAWAASVPEQAPRQLEFSRYRIRRSTCRSFIGYWEQSEELRRRFPRPWAGTDEDSFFGWLCTCEHEDVQEYLKTARRLQALWRVDIEETAVA